MKVIKKKKEELEEIVAEFIGFKILEVQRAKKEVILGIPGGTSVKGIFKNLLKKDILWENVHIFMVDERMVDLNDKDSNFKLAKETFIDELVKLKKLPEKNIHPFNYKEGIEKYNQEFNNLEGKFDIVLLSAGEDCHIASLFSKDSILNEKEGFILINDSPKPPKDRMSASRKLLEKTEIGILLFFGKTKQKAFEDFEDKKIEINSCPAKIVPLMKESYVFVTDE